jgi:hypothetical protein
MNRVSASLTSNVQQQQQQQQQQQCWEDVSFFSPESIIDLSLDNGDLLALSQVILLTIISKYFHLKLSFRI